jgi:hypothetical protein
MEPEDKSIVVMVLVMIVFIGLFIFMNPTNKVTAQAIGEPVEAKTQSAGSWPGIVLAVVVILIGVFLYEKKHLERLAEERQGKKVIHNILQKPKKEVKVQKQKPKQGTFEKVFKPDKPIKPMPTKLNEFDNTVKHVLNSVGKENPVMLSDELSASFKNLSEEEQAKRIDKLMKAYDKIEKSIK